jgi:hypothetical protein
MITRFKMINKYGEFLFNDFDDDDKGQAEDLNAFTYMLTEDLEMDMQELYERKNDGYQAMFIGREIFRESIILEKTMHKINTD